MLDWTVYQFWMFFGFRFIVAVLVPVSCWTHAVFWTLFTMGSSKFLTVAIVGVSLATTRVISATATSIDFSDPNGFGCFALWSLPLIVSLSHYLTSLALGSSIIFCQFLSLSLQRFPLMIGKWQAMGNWHDFRNGLWMNFRSVASAMISCWEMHQATVTKVDIYGSQDWLRRR